MAKALILIGIVFIVAGLLWHFNAFKGLPLGRLPGDIVIERETSRFYFPITTSILLSVLLSFLLYLFQKFK